MSLTQGGSPGFDGVLTPSRVCGTPLSRRSAARRSLTLQSFSEGALWAAGRAGEGKGEGRWLNPRLSRRGLRYGAPWELSYAANFGYTTQGSPPAIDNHIFLDKRDELSYNASLVC
jgi:hypothetical protein